jgi:hypothetical protein
MESETAMGANILITAAVFSSFLKCPMKAHRLCQRANAPLILLITKAVWIPTEVAWPENLSSSVARRKIKITATHGVSSSFETALPQVLTISDVRRV